MQTAWVVLVALGSLWAPAAGAAEPLYVFASNDMDPTMPTSQPEARWYHWLGTDPAVTHLETGLAIDAGEHADRGQRIEVTADAPIAAVQVKMKRIGAPGALCWQVGTAWGRDDLGSGEVAAGEIGTRYERFVTLPLRPAKARQVFVRLRAASGKCPDDYYGVYCTWAETPARKATIRAHDGTHSVG
ncbi:MAG: hypothetical protein NTW96_27105 [Planctomycetia bacterium]|nr:hypothetical protein [Planctomycetia bacterium]